MPFLCQRGNRRSCDVPRVEERDALGCRTGCEGPLLYLRRAAALMTGTGKDLLEATAAHILVERNGSYPQTNFPGLLGQAFVALGMTTPRHPVVAGEPPQKKIERAMFDLHAP